jgi:hypothetical protein
VKSTRAMLPGFIGLPGQSGKARQLEQPSVLVPGLYSVRSPTGKDIFSEEVKPQLELPPSAVGSAVGLAIALAHHKRVVIFEARHPQD